MDFPTKKYQIIYADPPWQYSNFKGKGTAYGDVLAHYNTLSLEELKNLPIQSISDENCLLFMWATYPNLKEGLELLESWGFKYKTVAFTWVKTRGSKKEPIFNPYKDEKANSMFLSKIFVEKQDPTGKYICCICGFKFKHGIKTSQGFICLKDFTNPYMFSSAKVISSEGYHYNPHTGLDNWLIVPAIKTKEKE